MADLADELGRYLNVATQPSPSVLKERSEPNLAFTGDTVIPPPSLGPSGMTPRRRWLLAGLVTALAVAVVVLFGLLLGGFGGEETVTVAIESDPPGAAVFVGGKRLGGLTRTDVALAPGTYDVRLELDRHRPHSDKLVVRADGQRTFRFPLEK